MIRWGLIGTGAICKQFARAFAGAEAWEAPAQAHLAAVASRTEEGAARFAAEFGVPKAKAYGSYEALLADPEIDAVYVGTPHPAHCGNVLAALRAGKPVLCEKPLAMNAREAGAMVAEARARNLFLMEAMWTRWLPVTLRVREWIASGAIGEVRMLKADFGGRMEWKPKERLLNKALGGGALLDVGIYPVSYAAMLFGTAPLSVHSAAHIGETGVDEQASVLLHYPGGAQAVLTCALRTPLGARAEIFGTAGRIVIPDFYGATEATLYPSGQEPTRIEAPHPVNGFAYELREATRCLASGLKESPGLPLDESLAILRLMDTIRKDWDLRYEADLG